MEARSPLVSQARLPAGVRRALWLAPGVLLLWLTDGRRLRASAGADGQLWVDAGPPVRRSGPLRASAAARQDVRSDDPDLVRAPSAGRVQRVCVRPGQQVEAGALLLVIEVMKMTLELRAGRAGRVESLETRPGAPVERGAVLVRLSQGGTGGP